MRAAAFCVHVLTACGAGVALMALTAAVAQDWTLMFALLGLALVIDAVDGPLARRLKVHERLPRWSGETLDLVVDFTTYVFVPAYAIAMLAPGPLGLALSAVIAVTGALYFADRDMKTDDNYFRGFPAVWNLVAFYLLLLRPSALVSAATVAAFAALQFVPVRFVHPLRVRALRPLTLALLALWGVLALIALHRGLAPGFWVAAALSAIALYFLAIGLLPPRRP